MLHNVRPINKSFCLQTLCEDNYTKFLRLIPNIKQAHSHNMAVKVDILETGPFTHTVLLHSIDTPKPIFKCRVYLDTLSIEVISADEHTATTPRLNPSPRDILNSKWNINYFFEKWLIFQLHLSKTEQPPQQAVST
ncbi:MAG: hypothetical protein A6F70_00155 [Cycloclasticus sp. symbiont of Bathymodiolus heckerae]|nr:MAG: hypothetical protein A6F70_00155 [Cycloclasticus sp. symbiont of Bathymodiolus heckerae]